MVGWLLTLPAAGAVGAFAALMVVWLGPWGIGLDAVLAAAVVTGLFLRSRRSQVTSSNAMSEVAVSGRAVTVPSNPPPTRRPRRLAREEAPPHLETSGTAEDEGPRSRTPGCIAK